MSGYLLDTNHLSDAIKPVSRVRERIDQAHRSGRRVGTCVPVLCELEMGLRRVSHRES
jgi:predicted nucleic acid-binding protein